MPYYCITRMSPHKINRTFRVNQDITEKIKLFYIGVEFYVRNDEAVPYECFMGYDLKQECCEEVYVNFVDALPEAMDSGLNGSSDLELFDTLSQLLGLDQHATPEEVVAISMLAALLAALLGGGGLAGGAGGAGGALPSPIESGPGGPPPIENPYQGVEDKYVTHHPDGSITIKDPITGEQKLYLPDGHGGYDNPLGGGYKSKEDMLNHLAYLDRNRYPLSQDAETAARNQAEQREQWDAQNARDRERGYSDDMADYRDWVKQQEYEIKKEERIAKLASEYGVEATEEAVKRAIKLDQIQAGIESAKQEAEAADINVTVVALESTKNVAATSRALSPSQAFWRMSSHAARTAGSFFAARRVEARRTTPRGLTVTWRQAGGSSAMRRSRRRWSSSRMATTSVAMLESVGRRASHVASLSSTPSTATSCGTARRRWSQAAMTVAATVSLAANTPSGRGRFASQSARRASCFGADRRVRGWT